MSTTYSTNFVDNVQLPDDNAYPIRSSAIPYGEVDSTSTSTAYTATVDGVYNLQDGVCVLLKNGVVTSSSGFTININSLGAKPVYASSTGVVEDTVFNANSSALFIYNSTLVSGGCWLCYRGFTQMTILSYGNSTWNDFLAAYKMSSVVYCRASSNSNPATGSQTRLAFMAYVSNETNPTNVEFQYYRSVSSHSDSQQGDQVYVYKLTSSNQWTVTIREAYTKIVAGTNMSSSYSNGVLTLSASGGSSVSPGSNTPIMDGTAAVGTSTAYAREDHVHPSDTSKQDTLVSGTNIRTLNTISLLGNGNITISYDAGTGLTNNNNTFNHSNSVTSRTTMGIFPIAYDSEGHITGSGTEIDPVSKSGDTMTGALQSDIAIIDGTKSTHAIKLKSNNLTSNTTVDSNRGGACLVFQDSNSTFLSSIGPYFLSNGNEGIALIGERIVNNTPINNSLHLRITPNGTRTVYVSEAEPWRDALGLGNVLSDITALQDGLVIQTFTGTRNTTNVSAGNCNGMYIPFLGLVIINLSFTAVSSVNTSATLYTIPSKYRPSAAKGGSGYFKTSSATGGGGIYVNSSGTVYQTMSNSATGGFGIILYTL